MPFAATVMHLLEKRSQTGIAQKVDSLLRNGPLANNRGGCWPPSVRWREMDERTLLAAMEAAGLAREEGAAVPVYTTFMPFAATVKHLFEKRSQIGIATKVRSLLLDCPLANKLRVMVLWSEEEETTLLDAMEAAGLAREKGAAVQRLSTFMPFAATVMHLLGSAARQALHARFATFC